MKIMMRIAASALLTSVLLFFAHCGGSTSDPAPAETDTQKNTKLIVASSWTVQSVLVDAVDKSTVYKDLKLTFTAGGFTATNGGTVWPASGSWSFTDDSGKVISRSDGVTINLTEISATKMVLSLAWTKTTLSGGRAQSVSGQHVFTFGK